MADSRFWNQRLEAPWQNVPLVRDAQGVEWEEGAQQRDPHRLRARVQEAVQHWIDRARNIPVLANSGGPPIPLPTVQFDLKDRATAGAAVTVRHSPRHAEQWIRINPDLMHRYPVRMIQQTIPHEVAHLVVDWYRTARPEPEHGPAWMAVMIWFGRPPLTHHDMQPARQAPPKPRSLRRPRP